ncbi:TetR/AcrR family transcriptional regulator [Clostridium sp. PL3]|uniref:TetR/AcrR family transcriptional regulator n=1 Tax=Clostridium thailandense TaxID=2794346 RepID=A0A949WPM8_9CLOT|nr:TetR/AcrR family transcriptional regulator [Clostridium thailandense]MBV7271490.1 TetR/AcrR family transcriptional regulator [Clostridium thailandense]
MKKNISKEQIIETALDLIKTNQDIRSINLREIARALGCAHTNIYNYYPSLVDLLWDLHVAIQESFIVDLSSRLEKVQESELKLYCFFESVINVYLIHTGWFRLVWVDYIGTDRPESNKIATQKNVDELVEILIDICFHLYQTKPDKEKIMRIFHNVHCYIVGELSNFINGRQFYQDEISLRKYVPETATTIFKLCLKDEIQ